MSEQPARDGFVGLSRRIVAGRRFGARRIALLTIGSSAACSGKNAPPANAASADSAALAATAAVAIAPGPGCQPTGFWARCSVMYRLERTGIAPQLDSTKQPERVSLRGSGFVVKLGRMASLDVFLYPDSAARIADEQMLDRKEFVRADAPQTIRRERTLIENANLVALLTSLNDRMRERVSDALTAGPPQAPRAASDTPSRKGRGTR